MSSSVDKSSGTQSPITGQTIVYLGIGWSVLSLLFFLLFSITAPGEDSPFWYMLGTYVLETLPFFAAGVLCYRNWRSPNIASGRNVWLCIGLGMLAWFMGNLLFGWWELYWGLDPDVSPADLFYLSFYVLLIWGMVLAVLPRRLNLETWQWVTVGAIAAVGIALGILILLATPSTSGQSNVDTSPSATEQLTSPQNAGTQTAPGLTTVTPVQSPAAKAAEETLEKQTPGWVMSIEETLSPLSRPVNFFYIIGDVLLLIIAAALLLAFWGGRFSQSWRMIAAATFCLYVVDMWFKYIDATAVEYESGGLPEVLYVFSGVLFAIGAALEYDVSSRSRRSARKRA